jgi:hypothetical protein
LTLKKDGSTLQPTKANPLATIEINCDQEKYNLSGFQDIKNPIRLVMTQKKPWAAYNLNTFQTSDLTVENMILNDRFVNEIAYVEGDSDQLDNLSKMTLKNCSMSLDIQDALTEIFMWRNAARADDEATCELIIKN